MILNKTHTKANLSISHKINSSFIERSTFCFNQRLNYLVTLIPEIDRTVENIEILNIKFILSHRFMLFGN